MAILKTALGAAAMLATSAGLLMAQSPPANPNTQTTPPPATPAPPAAPPAAAAPLNCDTEFKTLDTNADGFLSELEAPAAWARARVDGLTPHESGLTLEQHVMLCSGEAWGSATPEAGAPFEGANSFTENQARDRATAWYYTDVSALTKDDKGIWRGTAQHEGKPVNIAIDYKGNVVGTPSN